MAATMRGMSCTPGAETLSDLHRHDSFVPMYEITGESSSDEAAAAVCALDEISDRLRRLRWAYGEWREFDAGAYFDLSLAQARRLVRVTERVSTVHVSFYADLLLPSFRNVEHYWFYRFCPAYWQMVESLRTGTEPSHSVNTFTHQVQPEMIRLWTRLCEVVNKSYALLRGSSSYLIAYLCEEERGRWQQALAHEPADGTDLLPQAEIGALPTLSLSIEFPLPAGRQPGRLRRLRSNRAQRRPARFLRRSTPDS